MAAMPTDDASVRSIRRFNGACSALALVGLLFVTVVRQARSPSDQDFSQYYMAGVVVQHGEWAALYPDPYAGVPVNPGNKEGSAVKPRTRELAERYGAHTDRRFMQVPATAMLFAWLPWMSYGTALWVWLVISALAGWGVAVQAGRIGDAVAGRASRLAGVAVLLVAWSPLMCRAVRAANVSTLVAFCVGAVVLDVIRPRPVRGGVAIVVGTLLKYAPLVLIVVARRSRGMVVTTVIGLAVFGGLCVAAGGGRPLGEFVHRIAPTLGHSSNWTVNQTLNGTLLRCAGVEVLPRSMAILLGALRWCVLAVVLLVIFAPRRASSPATRGDAVRVVGESAALLTWVVIFAPVAWEHYYVYFCPFWGWLFGEVALGGWRRYVAGAVLLAHAIPWPILNRPIVAREPFASVMLIGAGLLLVLSLSRLGLTREPATVPLTPHTPERQGPGERPFAAG